MTPTTAADTTPRLTELATVPEVAAYLKLTPYSVRAYARDGVLPAYRVGRTYRFRWETVRSWLDSRLAHPSNSPAEPAQLVVVDPVVEPAARRKASR